MSVHDQPEGQGDGDAAGTGATPVAPTMRVSIVDAAGVPLVPDVAKGPTMTASGITTVAVPPGTRV